MTGGAEPAIRARPRPRSHRAHFQRRNFRERSTVMTESTLNDAARAVAEEARGLRDAARAAARRARTVGNAEIENLVSDVEELIARLADTADPAIAGLRSRVADTVRST